LGSIGNLYGPSPLLTYVDEIQILELGDGRHLEGGFLAKMLRNFFFFVTDAPDQTPTQAPNAWNLFVSIIYMRLL
jgi:hypothetical protein